MISFGTRCSLKSVAVMSASLLLGVTSIAAADESELLGAIRSIKAHVTGDSALTNDELAGLTQTIDANKALFGTSRPVIKSAMDLVQTFDKQKGALWAAHPPMNTKNRKPEEALRWAIFWAMQHLFDHVYTTEGFKAHRELIDGFSFASADHFPGKVEAPIQPAHTVKINGSYPVTWGSPVMHMDRPARKPTGSYLKPGTIATVVVPEALVGKGYQVRVGAHSWDHTKKPRVLRLYRVSAVYDINATEVRVANPLGGGIYIEVPYEADAGVVEVTVKHAARSPYFSAKPFHRTTNQQWREVERNHRSPWVDFQSEKYMMQLPRSWVYALDDPTTLMNNWDKSLDAFNDVMGRPHLFGREILYNQVDTQLRGRAFHPGYPSGNRAYDPTKDYGGNHGHFLVQGPQHAHSYEFHELGHAFLFPKWAGGREAAVNFPHVGVMVNAFGMGLQEAFRSSRSVTNEFMTLETTAIAWMMSNHFVADGLMRNYERQYQLKGHAKYVDVVRLFGWEAITRFFRSAEQDYMDGKPWPKDSAGEDGDRYTFRLSQAAGADLRPLIHFWGIPIVNRAKSDAAFKQAGIEPSAKVYDHLMKYKALIPEDNAAFRAYALKWWGKEPDPKGYTTQRNHAERWNDYDEAYAKKVHATVQAILDDYFPGGRPKQ